MQTWLIGLLLLGVVGCGTLGVAAQKSDLTGALRDFATAVQDESATAQDPWVAYGLSSVAGAILAALGIRERRRLILKDPNTRVRDDA